MFGRPESWPDRADDCTANELRLLTEAEAIAAWRLLVLIEASYPLSIAEHLAKDFEVDLHQAVDLVKAGCPPATAEEILT